MLGRAPHLPAPRSRGCRYARRHRRNGPSRLISIDALRADHLPAYGYRQIETPAIDSLAADGVVFERAYSHAPQTLPAHASLLSGRLPFETGVRDGVGFVLPTAERLLPQMLRERGFTTGGVVSAYVLRKETGISQGFDFFDGEMPASDEAGRRHRARWDPSPNRSPSDWLESGGQRPARSSFPHLDEPRRPLRRHPKRSGPGPRRTTKRDRSRRPIRGLAGSTI